MTGYFEIIGASSQHIYHSALVVAPKDSIVRKLYESHAHPFTRVVRGVPTSWDASIVAKTRLFEVRGVAWSPCDRFIAVTWRRARTVDVLDSAILQQLQTLKLPREMHHLTTHAFSPDSRILTCFGYTTTYSDSIGPELFVVSWDLQTGGVASIVRWRGPLRDIQDTSITYSTNGKMVGVFCCFPDRSDDSHIFICDVSSGALVRSHSLGDTAPLSELAWTHGECLRFATVDIRAITIWEVGFTSGTTPTKVETFPTPDDCDTQSPIFAQFHPATCRLASNFQKTVWVWDGRNSRNLLRCTDADFDSLMSFSSDGHFFACSTIQSGIYLWKESLAGYMLHGILAFDGSPLLVRNGESIVTFGRCMVQLWRTKSLASPSSRILTEAPQSAFYFITEFSPDGMLAVVAKLEGYMVTVLDLKSGAPQLTVYPGIQVYGLGVIGNTVVVIGCREVVAWDLLAGDCVPGSCVGTDDSSWKITLRNSPRDTQTRALSSPEPSPDYTHGASISPDSRHIALTSRGSLYMYSASTGELLWKESRWGDIPRFSLDGCDLWCADDSGEAAVRRVGSGREALGPLQHIGCIEHPPEGYPWGSSRGYRVTDDWWILGPAGKRLLKLPPPWQFYAVYRVWNRRFLALLHSGLPEPVILELEVNRDL